MKGENYCQFEVKSCEVCNVKGKTIVVLWIVVKLLEWQDKIMVSFVELCGTCNSKKKEWGGC